MESSREPRHEPVSKKGREKTPCPKSTTNCAGQLGVETAADQAEAGERHTEQGHRRATFRGLGGLMDGLNDRGRAHDAARERGEEDILGHVDLVEGGVDHQLVTREGLGSGIFQVADRGGIGASADVADAGLGDHGATETAAANGFTDEDEAARAAGAEDKRLINRRDQGRARSGGHGVIEIDIPGAAPTQADEGTLDGQVVGTVGVRGDIHGGVVRAQMSRAKREIGEDFVAESDAAIIGDQGAKIYGSPVGRGRGSEERHNQARDFQSVLHEVQYLCTTWVDPGCTPLILS